MTDIEKLAFAREASMKFMRVRDYIASHYGYHGAAELVWEVQKDLCDLIKGIEARIPPPPKKPSLWSRLWRRNGQTYLEYVRGGHVIDDVEVRIPAHCVPVVTRVLQKPLNDDEVTNKALLVGLRVLVSDGEISINQARGVMNMPPLTVVPAAEGVDSVTRKLRAAEIALRYADIIVNTIELSPLINQNFCKSYREHYSRYRGDMKERIMRQATSVLPPPCQSDIQTCTRTHFCGKSVYEGPCNGWPRFNDALKPWPVSEQGTAIMYRGSITDNLDPFNQKG